MAPTDSPASPRRRIAIYDLDRTITRAPTWTPFLLHAVLRHAPWRLTALPLVLGAAGLRAAGLLHRDRLKQVMHRAALGTLSPARAEALAAAWVARFGPAQIRPGARAQIAADRGRGLSHRHRHRRLSLLCQAIAQAVDADALIATRTATDTRGNLLPRIEGQLLRPRQARDDRGLVRRTGHRPRAGGGALLFGSRHRRAEASPGRMRRWRSIRMPPCAASPEQRGWAVVDWG